MRAGSDRGTTIDGAPARGFRGLIIRVVAGLILLTIALGFVVADRIVGEVQTAERNSDVEFLAAAALADLDLAVRLVKASGREVLVQNPGDVLVVEPASIATTDSRFDRWRSRTMNHAISSGERRFETVDPEGERWWHTAVRTIDGGTLVGSQPEADATAGARRMLIALGLGLGSLLFAQLAIGLWVLRRVDRPLRTIVAAADDMRFRGEIRPATLAALTAIRDRPVELRELSRLLQRIESESLRGYAQSESLLTAANALGSSLDQETILERSLDHLQRLLDVDRSVILAYDHRGESFEIIASKGHSAAYLAALTENSPDENLPSRRSLREREPVQVPDISSAVVGTALRERARKFGYRSLLAVPLADDLERPTVLLLQDENPRTFSYDEVELSRSFASIAGAAIRNAELFSRTDASLRAKTSQLDAIVESVDQAILVERSNGRVLYANGRMQTLIGRDVFEPDMLATAAIDVLASASPDPERAVASLDDLQPRAESWADIELSTPHGVQDFRVRRFNVTNARGDRIGRGQVWTDISKDREIERMKKGLLATVSHEFRTPLALIKGYATTLLATDVQWDSADQQEFLQLVSIEADRLSDLVQRLLDMRRIDAGMLQLQLLPTEVSVVVNSALDTMPHQRARMNVAPIPELTIPIDAARVVTVLRNLLENACEYSGPDGVIDLTISATADEFVCRVRDRGPGIAPEMRERIFAAFVRADSSLQAEYGGVGLGLAIARGFVEAHGGRIRIDDPESGPGVEFSFTLPLDQPVAGQAGQPVTATARGLGVPETSP